MDIPNYQSIMKPLLNLISDGKEHSVKNTVEEIANFFNLSDEERSEFLPKGNQTLIYNRVNWAKFYLKGAGLLESTRTGFFKITDLGMKIINKNPDNIDTKFLERFPDFIEFKNKSNKNNQNNDDAKSLLNNEGSQGVFTDTPDVLIEKSYNEINDKLKSDLLEKINEMPPHFFEKLVCDLFEKNGIWKG